MFYNLNIQQLTCYCGHVMAKCRPGGTLKKCEERKWKRKINETSIIQKSLNVNMGRNLEKAL